MTVIIEVIPMLEDYQQQMVLGYLYSTAIASIENLQPCASLHLDKGHKLQEFERALKESNLVVEWKKNWKQVSDNTVEKLREAQLFLALEVGPSTIRKALKVRGIRRIVVVQFTPESQEEMIRECGATELSMDQIQATLATFANKQK